MKNLCEKKIPLQLIVDAIEMAMDEWNQYLDIEKMEIVSLPDPLYSGNYEDEEDQELAEQIEELWKERFFPLPSKFDIHEYSIMERFVYSLPRGSIQDHLENAIRGRGAFRRFKDGCIRYGVEQDWYDFQAEAYRKLAIEWCEDYSFEYTDNTKKAAQKSSESPEEKPGGKTEPQKDPLAWEEIYTEHLVRDEWIDFRRSSYRFPDGSVYEPYYSFTRKDYVVIVATDEDGNYLCVRQFRQGIHKVTTEFPAGAIEKKDSGNTSEKSGKKNRKKQNAGDLTVRKGDAGTFGVPGTSGTDEALIAAKRELLEETGYASEEWERLLAVPSDATLSDNYAYIFAARNCRKVSGQDLDAMEFLNVEKHSGKEISEMIRTGQFEQAVHVMAWLLAQ